MSGVLLRLRSLGAPKDQGDVVAAEAEGIVEGCDVALGSERVVFAATFKSDLRIHRRRLIVGGTMRSCSASTVKIDSMAPAPPSMWPVIDLVPVTIA